MPQGATKQCNDKQSRQAEHIEEGYNEQGVGREDGRGPGVGHGERPGRRGKNPRLGPQGIGREQVEEGELNPTASVGVVTTPGGFFLRARLSCQDPTRRNPMRLRLSALALLALATSQTAAAEPAKHPNVLFIAVDDLNHWVGHLGRNPQTKTPNIDRLAKMGVTFTRAYCARPVCNPSRAALMSGLRPGTTGVYDNGQAWQPVIPKEQTLTTQFLKAGLQRLRHRARSTTQRPPPGEWTDYFVGGGQKRHAAPDAKNDGVGGIKFQPLTDDSKLPDESIVDYGIEQLKAKHDKPFFLASGCTSRTCRGTCRRSTTTCSRSTRSSCRRPRRTTSKDVPPAGLKMAKPDGDHAAMLKSGRWKEAVQAYLAAIAYCDAQIGRLLDAYDKSPHKDNTIIVFWGDHGWHLGEKEHWRKFALWEEATRMPLIWVARRDEAGRRVRPAGGPDERLPDAVRPVRLLDAEARRGREHQAAARATRRRSGTARDDDVPPEQPRGPHRGGGTSATPTAANCHRSSGLSRMIAGPMLKNSRAGSTARRRAGRGTRPTRPRRPRPAASSVTRTTTGRKVARGSRSPGRSRG